MKSVSPSDLNKLILENQIDSVKLLLETGINPNQEINNQLPLIVACLSSDLELVKLLLEKGADINKKSTDGSFPLIVSIWRQEPDLSKFLLEKGANPDMTYEEKTPLFVAVFKGKYKFVEILLQFNANVNTSTSRNETPLMAAAIHGYDALTSLLLKQPNIIVDAQNVGHNTALYLAAKHWHFKIVKKLLEAGSNPNIQCEDNRTALMLAVYNMDIEMINLLMSYKANINAQDNDGDSVVMYAVRPFILEELLEFKPNLELKNRHGQTALTKFIKYNELVEILLDAGANPNADDALIRACNIDNVKLVIQLISYGAVVSPDMFPLSKEPVRKILFNVLMLQENGFEPQELEDLFQEDPFLWTFISKRYSKTVFNSFTQKYADILHLPVDIVKELF